MADVPAFMAPPPSEELESTADEGPIGERWWQDPPLPLSLADESDTPFDSAQVEAEWPSPFSPDPIETLAPTHQHADLLSALEEIIADACDGSLTPAQVDSITALVRSVSAAFQARD